MEIFPCNTKTIKGFENPTNKSDSRIRILPFLPICKEIGQLSRAFSLFSLEKGLELVVRFSWELKQNKILAMAKLEPSPFARFIMILMALTKALGKAYIKSPKFEDF